MTSKALPSLEMPNSGSGPRTSRSGPYRSLEAIVSMSDFRAVSTFSKSAQTRPKPPRTVVFLKIIMCHFGNCLV